MKVTSFESLVTLASGLVAVAAALYLKARPQQIEVVPKKMKALLLVEGDPDLKKAKLEVHEVDTPKPRSGQILVKMVAAPINPSDDGEWLRPRKGAAPSPVGNEGSGIVVASGGGLAGWWMLGKRVAVVGTKTYMQYATTAAMTGAFELPKDVPVEDGCAYFINPFTVVGIVSTVLEHGEKIFIHTAAASQLGQMMVRYCKAKGVRMINVVRRQEQADILKALGEELIVDSSKDGWKKELASLIQKHQVRVAFDAVAGNLSGDLLTMMPPKSCLYVYGRLAPEPVGNFEPLDFIYRNKELKGWMLLTWLMHGGALKSMLRAMHTSKEVGSLLSTVFASTFQDTTTEKALEDYVAVREKKGLTGVKMRIKLNP